MFILVTRKAPNTTTDDFANPVDPAEPAQNKPSHLNLQCLPSSLYNTVQVILKVCRKIADVNLSPAFFALYGLNRKRDLERFSLIHCENTPMQYTAIFHGYLIFFLIFAQNIDCGYTLEPPQ